MSKHNRRIFAMNNPGEPLEAEIPFLLSCGVDGVELTIEPPASYLAQITQAWDLVKAHSTMVHTRDDLAFASYDPKDKEFALEAMSEAFKICRKLGLTRINVHPHRGASGLTSQEVFDLNVACLKVLARQASKEGLNLMLENQPPFTSCKQIREVLQAVGDDLYLLLDIAHAFCYGDPGEPELFIAELGDRIRHIHISDNMGKSDEHLFPGYGKADFKGLMPLIDKHVHSSVALSLESFRVFDGETLRVVTDKERGPLIRTAIEFMRDLD